MFSQTFVCINTLGSLARNVFLYFSVIVQRSSSRWDLRGCDRMVVGFTTKYAISAIITDVLGLTTAQGKVYNIM